MILDLLPYKRNKPGRLPHKWENLRYAHFVISLGLVLVLYFGFDYRVDGTGKVGLYWLIGGNVLYYLIGIILAYKLQDNRAFCKYVCPIPVLQKIPSRFALIKIAGSPEKCNDYVFISLRPCILSCLYSSPCAATSTNTSHFEIAF